MKLYQIEEETQKNNGKNGHSIKENWLVISACLMRQVTGIKKRKEQGEG